MSIYKNKDADELRGNHAADQHLCICCIIVQSLYFLNTKSLAIFFGFTARLVSETPENRFSHKALFFLILGLRIFFQDIKVGGGKKIKIKITKKIFFI